MNYFKRKNHSKLNNKNRGAALVFVIIIVTIIIILIFSLLLVTYNLYASQNKKAASLRSSEAAKSLSVALENELTDEDAYANSWLWKYLRFNMVQQNTWPYYDSGLSGHTEEYAFRYFDLKANSNYSVDGFPGETKLCVYWELPDGVSISDGDSISDLTIDQKKNFKVYIEITCTTGNQSYTIKNKYLVDVTNYTSEDDDEKSLLNSDSEDEDYNPLKIVATEYKDGEKWRFKFDGRD